MRFAFTAGFAGGAGDADAAGFSVPHSAIMPNPLPVMANNTTAAPIAFTRLTIMPRIAS